MTTTARRLVVGFALLGLASSLTAAYVHYQALQQPGYSSFCDISSAVSCTQVYLSRYGSVAGVPVALPGAFWFGLVLLIAAAGRKKTDRVHPENVPAYVFALSTLALAVILYLAYAAFFVLKAVCVLRLATYAAVVGIFVVSGAATSFPMTTLPRRAWRDLRALATSPLALGVAALFVASAAYAVALFPREAALQAASPQVPAVSDDKRTEFERWYESQKRVQVPVLDNGAKVVIVKFHDYQCPSCRLVFSSYKSVLAKYEAEDPGQVKLMVKEYPLNSACNPAVRAGGHPASCEAAAAVKMMHDPGQRERLQQWLFENQETLTAAGIKTAARDIGGIKDFDQEYPRALEEVKTDVALAGLLEVHVTPTFFINGVKIEGGLHPRFFDAAIHYELTGAW